MEISKPVERLADTHGLVTRAGTRIWASSEQFGWRTLFATSQHEAPFEHACRAVADDLVVVHLSGPVRVTRRLAGQEDSRVIPLGGAFVMPGGIDFGVRIESDLDTVHFYLHRSVVDEIAEECVASPATARIMPRLGVVDPLLGQIAIELREQLHDRSSATTLYADHLARAAAARLWRAHSTATVKPAAILPKGGLAERRLRRVIDFIEANVDRDPSLPELAALTGLSPVYFARQFRMATGVPPHQYLLQVRINRAKRLLASSGLAIAEIALDCGFCHQEHLTRMFRKLCGTTPAAYRASTRS